MTRMTIPTLPLKVRPKILMVGAFLTEKFSQDDEQEQGGDRQHGFGKAHQNRIDPAAKVCRHTANHRAQRDLQHNCQYTDEERDLASVDDAVEYIAAGAVGAKPVNCGWPDQAVGKIDIIGPGFRDDNRTDNDKKEQEQRCRLRRSRPDDACGNAARQAGQASGQLRSTRRLLDQEWESEALSAAIRFNSIGYEDQPAYMPYRRQS